MRQSFVLVYLVWKQCNVTSTLDCCGNGSLVRCASTCDSSRKNLTSFGNKLPKCSDILIIYRLGLLSAESTNFLSAAASCSGSSRFL